MSLKHTFVKLFPHFPGAEEFIFGILPLSEVSANWFKMILNGDMATDDKG